MEEILEVYHKVIEGGVDQDVYNYENVNIHFANGMLNAYDIHGTMPTRYPLPKQEAEFIALLEKVDKQYGEVGDNNQYICSKCLKVFDLPAAKENKMGFMACEHCANGGDIREDKDKEDTKKESPIPSTVKGMTVEDAIKLLKQNGYCVKKLLQRYKVVYLNEDGDEVVSGQYFRDKAEFERSVPTGRFISVVAALSDSEEVDID